MLYIEKEGLPKDVSSKIIELSKGEEWKKIDEKDTVAIRRVFDNDFPKNEVKKILIHEQHGICAYCMRRIRMDSHSRVEHLTPLSKDKDKAIDYSNMLGVCDGGEKITGDRGVAMHVKRRPKYLRVLLISFRWIKLHITRTEKYIQNHMMKLWRKILTKFCY